MNQVVMNDVMDIMETSMGANFQMFVPSVMPRKKEQTPNNNDRPLIKFSYYGDRGDANNHDGIITLATFVSDENNTIHYGVAYCSPKDIYNKEYGKRLAINNLRRFMNTVNLVKKTHHDINSRIFANIVAMNDAPSWAKRMVAVELIIHLEKAFDAGFYGDISE
jgi:hypothetical protein